jgi:hypothetical protein
MERCDPIVRPFEAMIRRCFAYVTSVVVGCGGSAPEATAPSPAALEAHVEPPTATTMPIVEVAAEEPVRSLPTQCVEGEGPSARSRPTPLRIKLSQSIAQSVAKGKALPALRAVP